MRVPNLRLHKPSGRAVVTLAGRDYYCGKFGSAEADEEYAQLLLRHLGNRGKPTIQAPVPTIRSLLNAYLAHVTERYAGQRSSEPRNIRLALRPVVEAFGALPATDFGPKRLKTVRDQLIKSGLCRNEVNKRIRRIVHAFKWAVGDELIPQSIHQALKCVEGLKPGDQGVPESDPVTPVLDEYVDAIKPHVPRQVWAMIQLQRLTGMRSGEVCIIRTCDITMQSDRWTYFPSTHKTKYRGDERWIPLGPQARDLLKEWLRLATEEYLFQPREVEAERRQVLRANRKTRVQPCQQNRRKRRVRVMPGAHYRVESYRQCIVRACLKAGVPSWHPYQLRHNYGTKVRGEHGLDASQLLLGHKHADVTQVYAAANREKAWAVAEQIG
jgi:integrase